jgi:hypothetical protein
MSIKTRSKNALAGIFLNLDKKLKGTKNIEASLSKGEVKIILNPYDFKKYEEAAASCKNGGIHLDYITANMENAIQTFSHSYTPRPAIVDQFKEKIEDLKKHTDIAPGYHPAALIKGNATPDQAKEFFEFIYDAFKEKTKQE